MQSSLDQQIVDEKIHRFLARKSPLKTLSKTIAEHVIPIHLRKQRTGIAYEPARWSGHQVAHTH